MFLPGDKLMFVALKSCKLKQGVYLTEGETFEAGQEMEEKLRILYEAGCIDLASNDLMESHEETEDDASGDDDESDPLFESEDSAGTESKEDESGIETFVPLPKEQWASLSAEEKKQYSERKKAHEAKLKELAEKANQ